MTREETLEKAKTCVCGQQQEDYGTPEDNFGMIARLWSRYLGYTVNSADVAAMMILLKIARIRTGTGTEDCWVDIAGYAACGCEISSGRQKP